MTKIECELTMCKYNDSCCIEPNCNSGFCTKEDIKIIFDVEMSSVDCQSYAMSTSKPSECVKCQIKKYGSVKIGQPMPTFEIIESDDIPH